ncbi:MAG: flagellar basal-body rod protein FlgB [Flavobacteriales bacterium]
MQYVFYSKFYTTEAASLSRLRVKEMSISFDKAVGMREQALMLRAEKANILSSNLANIDTPNYKAKDIDFHAELTSRINQSSGFQMASGRSGHLDSMGSNLAANPMFRVPSQPSIDGNTVEEHVEHAEFMKNNLEFQVAFTLLNGSFKGLTKAIKGE